MTSGGDWAKAPSLSRSRYDRRGSCVLHRCPSAARQSTELFHPRHQRTGQYPVATSGAVSRLERLCPGGTRLSLSQRSPLSGLLAFSQKAREAHSAVGDDDRGLAGVCGVGVSHSHIAEGSRRHLCQPQEASGAEPDGTVGFEWLTKGLIVILSVSMGTCSSYPGSRLMWLSTSLSLPNAPAQARCVSCHVRPCRFLIRVPYIFSPASTISPAQVSGGPSRKYPGRWGPHLY
jgi:hypothetical protein